MQALLALEDGTLFHGESFGATGTCTGEAVFNTSMTGYQEILSDPSYKGQLVTMTYTLQGNYGVTPHDTQSRGPQLTALLVKELTSRTSNWRAAETLDDYLKKHDVMGMEGLDTRALTRHVRNFGAMRAALSTEILDPEKLVETARGCPPMQGLDLVQKVSCDKRYEWTEPELDEFMPAEFVSRLKKNDPTVRVVVLDCGVKYGILRKLVSVGCAVTVVPADTPAADILALDPDGVLFSNGPGDPEPVVYAVETAKELIGKKPLFGICLGHQILSLALGAKSYKLKFGHRGANHPVKDLATGQIWITAQNHGFAIEPESLEGKDVEASQINLYDQTLEGIRHKKHPVMAVQYHPEASPGPNDALGLFWDFREMMLRER